MAEPKSLPEYEDLIDNLADQLGGLSVVHRGVGDATASLVAANREFANLQLLLENLVSEGQQTLQEIRRLEPALLESAINNQVAILGSETNTALGALRAQLGLLEAGVTARGNQLLEQSASLNEHIQEQQIKFQQFGKLIAVIATGETPFQTEVVSSIEVLRTHLRENTDTIQSINRSFESSMSDIGTKTDSIWQHQRILTSKLDGIQSTATDHLSNSERLGKEVSSQLDTVHKGILAETRKLLTAQGLMLIILILVLISVWLTA